MRAYVVARLHAASVRVSDQVVNTISGERLVLVLSRTVRVPILCRRPGGTVAEIELVRVSKVYGGGVVAVDDVSLTIRDGEFIVLVGPSGCGKSTLLRMMAGLEDVTAGEISIGGRHVTDLAPRHRDVAMVFQSYALYPHMSVRQNLGYGLKVRRTSKEEVRRRVDEVARLLGLEDMLDRRPAQLSGGQRQRVAMGRAIVREPRAFLMDEPLSNLDAKLRVGMRASLAQLHARLGVTTVYVTHDQVEAMTLGQRVAVMRSGRILQVAEPQRLYAEPVDLFVAAFIGSPAMNLVEATIEDGHAVFGQFRLPLDGARRPEPGIDRVILGMRPESFEDAAFARGDGPEVEVAVTVVEELGSDAHVFFEVDAPRISAEALTAHGDDATLLAEEKSLFTARVDPATAARPGGRLRLSVDPRRFHFFDPRTGATLLAPTSTEPAAESLTAAG
jgi:multiple sugar transport system ATP-binding protein